MRRRNLVVALCAATLSVVGVARAEEVGRFAALGIRELGPKIGGRVSRVAGVPGDPRVYYAATAQGGVWKSEDGGHVWEPVFDDAGVASTGSVAVAPSDPNVVWVGSGEANPRGNVIRGRGIWRSTDAGESWTRVWEGVGQVGAIAVHPADPDTAFAAVLGDPFAANPERGVYRTTDGGATWQKVLFVDAETGASDVAVDPSNPRVVFAGTWPMRRTPWEMTSGGPGGGLWRSTDGGASWTRLEGGELPAPPIGKVGVAVAPADGRRVYALIEAAEGGLFRSDDGGATWRRVNAHRSLRQRAFYYSVLAVDPADPETVWFPQVGLLRSPDGGETIAHVDGVHHGDVHDVWLDPRDPRRLAIATDGGVEISLDGGASWRWAQFGIAQAYNLDADRRVPYHVGATLQDFGTASGPSNSLRSEGIVRGDWLVAGGGEAGDFVYDPFDDGVVYAGEYMGILTVHDRATGATRNVTADPDSPSGHTPAELPYRFQWTAPIAASPLEPDVLYHGANVLFRSTDRGRSWRAISPDLTRDDETRQRWSGGPITGDNTGVEVYGTIFSIAPSPHDAATIWAGSDDGRVHVTRDGGATWNDVTPPALPAWGTVDAIEISPHADATVWVAVSAYRVGDPRPHLYGTTDGGASWRTLGRGLPEDESLFVVREDPARAGLLYAGTELGLHLSRDGGASWEPLAVGLPPVKVVDLAVREDDLAVATSGRGIWILDGLGAIRAWSAAVESARLHLFPPAPAVAWRLARGWSRDGAAENPPHGVVVDYWLGAAVEGEVSLEVLDAQGRLVRRLSSVPEPAEFGPDDPDEPTEEPEAELSAEAGLHRAVWDLAWKGARRPRGIKIDLGDPTHGPMALPGRYTLWLRAGELEATAEAEVLGDPRSGVPAPELAEQLETALALRARLDRLADEIDRVRAIRGQAAELAGRLGDRERLAPLVEVAAAVVEACSRLEEELYNAGAEVTYDIFGAPGGAKLHSKLSYLWETLIDGDGAPTRGVRETLERLGRRHDDLAAELAALEAGPLAEIDRLARELAVPRIVLPEAGGGS
ncbi:MAG TPA: glycosyl hydrolase [Thermoanaerobaculia bacterium]|nr:glycosyl hydrolase [Thermoanaerobaculia bacterium]